MTTARGLAFLFSFLCFIVAVLTLAKGMDEWKWFFFGMFAFFILGMLKK